LGRYVRNGNLVTAWFEIVLTALDGATTGNVTITGLPYAASSAMGAGGSFSQLGAITFSGSYNGLTARIQASTAVISLVQFGSNINALSLPTTGLAPTTVVQGQVTYRTN
jgi:hypothetical protein